MTHLYREQRVAARLAEMQERYLLALFMMPVSLLSLCVHEWAHAWVASRRGDPTPVLAGRLSLMPWAHWDLVGTILLPAACMMSGMPAFGWAKPVPIDARYFRNPRLDIALVAAAGPISNFCLAGLGAVALSFFHGVVLTAETSTEWGMTFFRIGQGIAMFMHINLALAFFNLLPIPPLDGFMIVQSVLPVRAIMAIQKIAPLSIVLVMALWIFGGLSFLSVPVTWAYDHMVNWALL